MNKVNQHWHYCKIEHNLISNRNFEYCGSCNRASGVNRALLLEHLQEKKELSIFVILSRNNVLLSVQICSKML